MIKSSPYDIVKNIMMTEKATILKEKNQYAFKVAPKATKLEVADAVEKIYGVKVKPLTCSTTRASPNVQGDPPFRVAAPTGRRPWFLSPKAPLTLLKETENAYQDF